MPATPKRRRAPAKKAAAPARVRPQPLSELLHPGVFKTAMEHAAGDQRKVEVISPTHAAVRI
jgi:hypothetical protein